MSLTEIFFSNVAVLQPVMLLRNGTLSYHPENCKKIFHNGYGLDKAASERIL